MARRLRAVAVCAIAVAGWALMAAPRPERKLPSPYRIVTTCGMVTDIVRGGGWG